MGDAGRHLADGGQLLRLQELVLRLPQLLDRALLALEELGVLDGEGGVAGQRLRRLQALRAEGRRGLLVVHVDGAQARGAAGRRPASAGSAAGCTRSCAGPWDHALASWPARVRHGVARGHRLAGLQGLAHHRASRCPARLGGSGPGPPAPVAAPTRRRSAGHGRVAVAAGAESSASSRKPRSARVMRMTASRTCSSTWLSDQGRVQGLHQREQELLLLDPRELGDLVGAPSGRERGELQGDVAELDLRARAEAAPCCDRAGVEVHAVQAALVLDGEVALLVDDAGVHLGDRGLGEAEVVVPRPAHV